MLISASGRLVEVYVLLRGEFALVLAPVAERARTLAKGAVSPIASQCAAIVENVHNSRPFGE